MPPKRTPSTDVRLEMNDELIRTLDRQRANELLGTVQRATNEIGEIERSMYYRVNYISFCICKGLIYVLASIAAGHAWTL